MRLTIETSYAPDWTPAGIRDGFVGCELPTEVPVEVPDLDGDEAPLAYIVRDRHERAVPLRSHAGGLLYHMGGLPESGGLAEGLEHGWRPTADMYGKPAMRRDPRIEAARANLARLSAAEARTGRPASATEPLVAGPGDRDARASALQAAFEGVRIVDGTPWHRIPSPVLVLAVGVTMARLELEFTPRPAGACHRHFPIERYAEAVEALVEAGGTPPGSPLVSACEPAAPAPGMRP